MYTGHGKEGGEGRGGYRYMFSYFCNIHNLGVNVPKSVASLLGVWILLPEGVVESWDGSAWALSGWLSPCVDWRASNTAFTMVGMSAVVSGLKRLALLGRQLLEIGPRRHHRYSFSTRERAFAPFSSRSGWCRISNLAFMPHCFPCLQGIPCPRYT